MATITSGYVVHNELLIVEMLSFGSYAILFLINTLLIITYYSKGADTSCKLTYCYFVVISTYSTYLVQAFNVIIFFRLCITTLISLIKYHT